MGPFAIAAAVLFVLVAALLLPATWRSARGTFVALAVGLPAFALAIWMLVGTPGALDPKNVQAPETLDDAIAMLERRLQDDPASVEGWVLLGRSRMSQERFADARDAFAKAHALLPDDPDLMVEYADAQMRAASDGRFPATATALLERVVEGQPAHQRGLFYLGAQRLQAGQAAEAAGLWERVLPLVDARTAAALRPQIDAARAQAGLPPLPAAAPPADASSPADAAAGAGPALAITVEITPELAEDLGDDAVLFVFARAVDGAGPPVAAKRVPAAAFPLTVSLSDADRLMPTQALSQQPQVQVLARISRRGDATAAAGDLEAAPQVVAVADGAAVTLRIDRVRP